MSSFDSLEAKLKEWFDKPFSELPGKQPETMRERIEREFFPRRWDNLTADQRREVARQLDSLNNPATEQEQEDWFAHYARKKDIERKIRKWELSATPTAGDMAEQEDRLKELKAELDTLERQARGGYPGIGSDPDHNDLEPSPLTSDRSDAKPDNATEGQTSATFSVRREVGKQDTLARHKSWKKEYRKLKKEHPGKSDTWYSGQIAKMEIAEDRNSETIRRNMKK